MLNHKNINILVIGTGSIGKRHIKNLSKIIRFVNVYSYRQIKEISEIDNIRYEENLDDAINNCDGIVIANRNDQHIETALKGISKDKFVFIEKPLSNSMKNIDLLKKLSIKKNKIIETGFMLRFHPNLLKLKEIICDQKFGKVHYVRVAIGQYLPDWRPHQDHRDGYGAKKKYGGGVTLDLIHEIDLVCWLFGKVDLVCAMFGYSPELEIETESISQINLKMRSGISVQIHLDYLRPTYWRDTEIVTNKGILKWNFLKGTLLFEDSKNNEILIHKVSDKFTKNNMYIDEMNHFIRTIQGNNKFLASNLQDAENALRVAFSAHESNKNKYYVDPQTINENYILL